MILEYRSVKFLVVGDKDTRTNLRSDFYSSTCKTGQVPVFGEVSCLFERESRLSQEVDARSSWLSIHRPIMVRYGIALSMLLSAASVQSFRQQHFLTKPTNDKSTTRQRTTRVQQKVSTSSSHSEYNDGSISDALNSVTNAARESISNAVSDNPDADEAEIGLRRKMVENRMKTYKVTLPLASSTLEGTSKVLSVGLCLRQIRKGRSFDTSHLNLDTLVFEEIGAKDSAECESMDEQELSRRVDVQFQGIVVSSVVKGSAAWTAGVRPGDILQATSATMGSQMWPKRTMEGVRSAMQSRKGATGSIEMEFQRLGDAVDNQFELSLTKPIGLEMGETEDGYVAVTGFTENAPILVQYAVKVGDRVLAVDSSLGDKMWPVSTVEGVVSAVTARLPGRPITFRFERPIENFNKTTEFPSAKVAVIESTADSIKSTIQETELLKRCRDIMKRYTAGEKGAGNFVNKYDLPGLVADKVLDALASAEARVDAVTLSMIMSAYLSCQQAQKAIDTFEAALGMKGDASIAEATAVKIGGNGKKLTANEAALDVFTVSSLLKAHAVVGDLASVKRVLAAIEGRAGVVVAGLEVAAWPGVGKNGSLKPDTRCYNTVMSAAANSKADDGLDLALDIFDSMSEPNQQNQEKQKDLVSYNIVLNALTNRGRYQDAVELFYEMKKAGIKPDKRSYTSLAMAITFDIEVEGDIEELFYDMKEQGVVPDVVTFNTAIKSLCKQKKISAAKKIVNMMEGSGVLPNSMTYGLLMKGLIDTGYAGAALTLFETACSDRKTVVLTENPYLYTTAISAAASLGDYERALELLSRMNEIGVKPNLKTMTAIMGACLAAGKPDLAVDIYHRISKPDGYAMTQGLQAICESGNTDEALAIIKNDKGKDGLLTGKQEMRSFKTLIETELRRANFDAARKVFLALIHGGNIPSKTIYRAVFDAMEIFPKARKGLEIPDDAELYQTDKFRFLLFMLDSIASRNLPCEGSLYSAILTYGIRVGGVPKKVSSYLATARTDYSNGKFLLDDDTSGEKIPMFRAWEDLFLRHDEMKIRIAEHGPPRLVVRAASRDFTSILRAERNLAYRRTKMV
eukprot:scaffold160_cov136-Cylindrotheca_fusiformis.AAC.2